jgi:hypothetical protein
LPVRGADDIDGGHLPVRGADDIDGGHLPVHGADDEVEVEKDPVQPKAYSDDLEAKIDHSTTGRKRGRRK